MEGQTAPPPTRTASPPYGRVLVGSTPTGPMDPHAAVALQRAGIDTPSAVPEEAARAAAAIGFQQASAAAAAFSRGHFLDENWSEPRPGRVFYPLQASTTTPALMPTPMAMQMPMPSFAIPYPLPLTRARRLPRSHRLRCSALRRSRRGPSARIGAKTMAGAVGPVAAAKAAAAAAVLETADGAEPSARGPATILRRRRTFATAAKSAAIGSTTARR